MFRSVTVVLFVAFVLTGAVIVFSPSLSFASPTVAAGKTTSVPIPLGKACEWAYPGQSNGAFSGSGYSVACRGKNGQVLGGFGGSHSLGAWCANPSHTGGLHLRTPALVKNVWECTGQAAASNGQVPIPLGKACEWAYPGLASGKVSGSGHLVECLGKKGQVLGGFTKSHSFSMWCASSRHTNGKHLPVPALVKHVWECTASAPSKPGPSTGPVPIPLGKACEWAYPGQSNGAYSGSAYSIECLGRNGQVLGGFGGADSLTAWCADSSHTDGRHLPDATLLKEVWVCAS